jgi:hypothetical protein
MYAAASSSKGVDGVSKSVAKEFVAADKPGKLPEKKPSKGRKSIYKE